ncbi:PREDICTED: uncharacterized protein LOC104822901 [Tarenaya hassleriana]|uniref:uncharacterized protein LOC104822901 n=1 Tax=Tarenaya hassleriana TaxID=28532 RepID=UPI00053C9D85|nr:PREDICTED: uncharacterized protein LOC104822901 [Tarenaya hassleriana]
MGAAVHCESLHYSMKDLSEESNSTSSVRPVADSRSGNEIDFLKRTMIEQEAVFKNQVSELHRLYRVQRTLVEELRQNKLNENLNQSEGTPENKSTKQHLPGFLSGNLENGGLSISRSRSRACSVVPIQNEVRPVKVGRKIIDLQLPAEEYMDTDGIGDPHERSKSGKEFREKQFTERGNGSCLGLKKFNGFADLNEPVHCQELEPVASSKDVYSLYGRINGDVHVKGHCLEKDISRNGWMVLETGHDKSNPLQIFSNNAFQPRGMAKSSGETTFRELPEVSRLVSYDSHVESSSVASSFPSPNGHNPKSVQPWNHWLSPWDNLSGQTLLPVHQVNPFLNCNTQGRTKPSFEISCRGFNGGSSSARPKEAVFGSHYSNHCSNGTISNSPFGMAVKVQDLESLHGSKKHEERSTGLSWLKPKPRYTSEITDGFLDLNASIHHQFTDETEMGDGFTNVSPRKSLKTADLQFQSSRKILGFPIFEKSSVVKEEKPSFVTSSIYINGRSMEENKSVERDLDINLPFDVSGSATDKEEGKRAVRFRHHIDLNVCASEDEDSGLPSTLRVKEKSIPWIDLEAPPATLDSEDESEKSPRKGEDRNFTDELKAAAETIVAISILLCDHPDEAASSSTDGHLKDPLSWFADAIICGDEMEKRIEAVSEGRSDRREECSSGEFDYFEAMTLSLVEIEEENYMPKPLVPENLNFDETGFPTAIPNRPRRGQPRRGRPKRDFRRDILPGLTSLARHEVAEDLQMFGGLTKTTGCSWNSGAVAARKNSTRGGSNRGRRKRPVANINTDPGYPSLTQSMNDNVRVGGPGDRSLSVWGRASRRPRRQRCPAGNNPLTVILT